MKDRFEVKYHYVESDYRSYYSVIDNQHQRWNLPEKAVNLYFGSLNRAYKVAQILNEEWAAFLADPW